jgi:hypothetical protein
MPTPLPLIFTPSSDSEEEENLPPLVAAAAAPVHSTSVTQSQSSSQGSVAGSPQQQWRATKRDALRNRPLQPPDFTTWEQWLDYRRSTVDALVEPLRGDFSTQQSVAQAA